MKIRRVWSAAVCGLLVAAMASAQAVYQPKFKGDPARSDSEAAALGYMRTFLRAQKIYKKKILVLLLNYIYLYKYYYINYNNH